MRSEAPYRPIRQVLERSLGEVPDAGATGNLVHICHSMAVAYLRIKEACGDLTSGRFGLTKSDVAFDAIAELFQRGPAGGYVVLLEYFRVIGPAASLTEDELLTALRRLVFSAVNQRIFRMYRESDPSLAKLIRNIKLTLKDHRSVRLKEHSGGAVIVPSGGRVPRNAHLPEIPPEFLRMEVLDRVKADSTLRRMLGAVGEALREQTGYRRMVTLIGAALMIRSVYADGASAAPAEELPPAVSNEEILGMISAVLKNVEKTCLVKYVGRSKLTRREADAVLAAVGDILAAEFTHGAVPPRTSYFEMLKKRLPRLERGEYGDKFRTVTEYLSRIARNGVKTLLKREL